LCATQKIERGNEPNKSSGRHSGWDVGIQTPGMASYGNRRCLLQAPALMSCDAKNKLGTLVMPSVCRPWTTGFRGPVRDPPTRNDGVGQRLLWEPSNQSLIAAGMVAMTRQITRFVSIRVYSWFLFPVFVGMAQKDSRLVGPRWGLARALFPFTTAVVREHENGFESRQSPPAVAADQAPEAFRYAAVQALQSGGGAGG